MQLKLQNVRQHKELTIDFPSRGLVYLSGRSGNGKTTIFDALEDALFDTGSDIQPWTGGTPVIELYLEELDLRIVKKRNPGSISATHNGETVIAEEAEALIRRLVGMNAEEFTTCSYIKQEGAGSLLSLTPADQLRFIQKISCNGFDPDLFKQTLNMEVNQLNGTLNGLKSELTQVFQTIENHGDILKEEPTLPLVPSQNEPNPSDIELLRNELQILLNKKSHLSKALNNNSHDLLAAAKTKAEVQAAQALEITKELNSHLANIPKAKDFSSLSLDLTAKLAESADALLYWEKFEQAKTLGDKFKETLSVPKEERVLPWLNAEAQKFKDMDTSLKSRINKLHNEINDLKKSLAEQSCPWCENPLSVHSGTIVKGLPNQKEIEENLSVKSAEETDLLDLIKINKNDWEIVVGAISQLDSALRDLPKTKPTVSREKAVIEVQRLRKELADVQKEAQAHDLRTEVEKTLKLNKIKAEAALKVTRDLITQLSLNLGATREEITKELEGVDEWIDDVSKKERALATLAADWKTFETLKLSYQKLKSVYDNSLSIIVKNNKRKEELKKEIEDLNTKMVAGDRLIELTNIAATSAIESKTEEINSNSAHFIDKFFEGDGTSINLTSTFKTQKGEERAKVGLEMFHKGQKAKKLSSFSGGEKARIRLAFQLGLSKLFNSPILLIDEGFSGLDEEGKNICIEVLREIAEDRLVLVIEHGISTDAFDRVLNVGSN